MRHHTSIDKEGYVILAGDFKITLSNRERRGGSHIRDPFKEVCEGIISEWDLMDIVLEKGIFTWSNKRQGRGHIANRLDRFLVQSDLMLEAIELNSFIIANGTSDHKPISLEIKEVEDYGPISCRFNPLWLQAPEVSSIIRRQWRNLVNSSLAYIF